MNESKSKKEHSPSSSSSSKLADTFEFNLLMFVGDFLKYFKRFWAFAIAAAILFAGGEFILAKKNFVPVYRSSVSFAITTLNSASVSVAGASNYSAYYTNATLSEQLGNTFQYVVESEMMYEVLRADLGVPVLNGTITTKVVPSTNIFKITVTSSKAEDAYAIVNSILENYPRVAEYVIGDTQMEIYVKPQLANEPINAMSWRKKVVIAAGVGFLFVSLILAVFALFRKTIKNKSDMKVKFNKEALVDIPYVEVKKRRKGKRVSLVISPRLPAFAEAYRTLKKRLLDKPENRVIALTSTMPGEGKTTVAFNLAYTLSMNGIDVALVDFDFQKNTVASFINSGDIVPGISDIDYNATRLDSIAFVNETDKHLTIYPAGNSKKRVSIDRLSKIIDVLLEKYQYVIIDMPPCGLVAEAGIMTSLADETLFVVRMDYAKVSKIRNAINYLNLCNANYEIISNGVMNGGLLGYGKSYYGGYSSKYGYHRYGYGKRYGGYGKRYGYGKSYGYGKGYGYGSEKGYGYGYGYGYGSSKGGYGYGYGYGYGSSKGGYGYGYGYGGYGYGYGGYGYGYGQKHSHKKKSKGEAKAKGETKSKSKTKSKKSKEKK